MDEQRFKDLVVLEALKAEENYARAEAARWKEIYNKLGCLKHTTAAADAIQAVMADKAEVRMVWTRHIELLQATMRREDAENEFDEEYD